ncbi:hypothetical protein [Sphingomonas sp. MMS24-J13]|uniref:hypothetical protein n=1 Tax=Sphingomonas sp. MMS24-J13 TaxID=3238686 RepID=UPI00384D8993
MRSPRSTLRIAVSAVLLAATSLSGIGPALAQDTEKSSTGLDLYHLPPIPKFTPERTSWGDPDLRGIWPIDSLGGLPLQRTVEQGNRVFLNDEEFAKREAAMEKSRTAAERETKANKLGMGNWVEMTGAGRRTSLLIDPPNGRLPELTEYGKKANAVGRSSWVRGQTYDWVTDFDSWDRCISRGFPASMLPFRYNNGIQIFQAPGYVVINLEMIHDSRIIPIGKPGHWPAAVTSWMGDSRGHWEGNTLVIETTNIKQGASPLNMATIGAPPNNTIPMGADAKVVERLTMANPNTLVYEMTFSDPTVWTKPYTVRLDWQRNQAYGMFEYACHEGDVQVRNYINASRADRAKVLAAADQKKADDAAAQQAAAAPAEPAKKKKK